MKVLELFAGAGGLALGIEQAGFMNIGAVEYDKAAAKTLKTNRPLWNVVNEDIAKLTGLSLCDYFEVARGELDLLSGGAPCQSFSYAGKRRGLADTRGTLFYHYALCLEQLQPKMFLFENVPGLLTHDEGNTYKTILNVFENAGYQVQRQVMNAWDYDVAQKRERLITIGIRKDLVPVVKFEFPQPHAYKPVLNDILPNCPKSEGAVYTAQKQALFAQIPQGGNWRNLPETVAKAYMKNSYNSGGGKTGYLRRLSMDEPALTILTTPSQKQTERCHPLEIRPLTVREAARCQSFPDDWVFRGSLAQQYRQVGNAVPVNLAKAIGLEIKKALVMSGV